MNVQIATSGDITDFKGDVIIIPCDSELSFTKTISPNPDYRLFKHESKQSLVKNIFEKAGKDLVKEVTTIGYCEVGYAVITKGYELKAQNVIFMPIADHNNDESRMNYVGLHQSLRAAFTLADLYNAKSVAIAGIRIPNKRKDFFKSLWDKFLSNGGDVKSLSGDEIEDIIITTSKNLEKNSIKDLFIYKYSQ